MDGRGKSLSVALVMGLLAVGPARAQTEAEFAAEACAEEEVAEREMASAYFSVLWHADKDPRLHEEIEKSQRAWLLYRAAHLQALYGAEYPVAHYGKHWPQCLCLANSELTELRIEQLRRMSSGTQGDPCSWERMEEIQFRALWRGLTQSTVFFVFRKSHPDRPFDGSTSSTGTICIAPFSVPGALPDSPPDSWPFDHWDVNQGFSNPSFTFRVDRHLTTKVGSGQVGRIGNVPIDRQVLVEVRLDQRPFETFFLHLRYEPEARVCLWFDPAYKRWLNVGWDPGKGCNCETDGKDARASEMRK